MAVRNLKELIQPYLEKHKKEFVSCECKNLLPVGENYGSTMLALRIKIINEDTDEEETLECVAKTIPPKGAVYDFFNVPVTFKNEVAQYTRVVPLLNRFGKEFGVENLMHPFAKCLGARISLNSESDVVDDDAVLLLENVAVQGYSVGDRVVGFDLATAKVVLSNMAVIHAAVIAFKLAKPEEFESSILPILGEGLIYVATNTLLDNLATNVQKYASRNPKCIPLLERIDKGTRKMKELFLYSKVREPFASIVHTDMWTNNMMIKYENGKPMHNIFVDFPLCRYGSPARDVLFFIYSSVKLEVVKSNVDNLIRFYYDELIGILEKLKCDLSIFSYELFLEDVEEVARDTEFCHLIFMLTPIFTVKGQAKELTEWSPEHIAPLRAETLHEYYYERLFFIVLDFAARNWI